jgi:hypothetical protein
MVVHSPELLIDFKNNLGFEASLDNTDRTRECIHLSISACFAKWMGFWATDLMLISGLYSIIVNDTSSGLQSEQQASKSHETSYTLRGLTCPHMKSVVEDRDRSPCIESVSQTDRQTDSPTVMQDGACSS